jgi:glycosyltransferase involved in cell wall biosynthesis
MSSTSEFDEMVLSRPAIGIIATGNDTDAVVRVVALAQENDHAVFVAYGGPKEPRSVQLARRIGAETVTPDDETTDEDVLRNVTAMMARSHGFPGLLFHSSLDEYIDYEQSREKCLENSDFILQASTSGSVDRESNEVLTAIPAYNEASTIGEVIRSVQLHADTVLIIEDGSTDDTAAVAEAAGAEVISHEMNKGYGAALKTAFTEAHERGVELLTTIDGDGQHDPRDIARLVEHQKETGVEIVIGSRFVGEANTAIPLYRWLGLLIVNFLTNLSLGVVRSESRVSDTQSGLRVYNKRAIETLAQDSSLGDQMSISTDILYHAQQRDYRIEEIGTVIDYGIDERSNHNPLAHGYVLVRNLLNTIEHTRPLMALALPGFLLTFVGLGFSYWGFLNYIQYSHVPLDRAAFAAFFILIGLLTCLTGIILHSLNKYFDKVSTVDPNAVQ